MGMITSIRAPVPIAEASRPAALEELSTGALASGVGGPVSATVMVQAVKQMLPKPDSNHPQILAVRMTAETSAAVAAEAARDAYIKASIAAGINPFPLS